MSAKLYPIRTVDMGANQAPLAGVLLQATSPTNGPWAAITDACGRFDPCLEDGHYTVTLSKDGYTSRVLEMDLANPPTAVILVGLDRAQPSFRPASRMLKGNMCCVRAPGSAG